MATEKQIEANKRNAALSTGPKSEQGKAQSRANALTHGLTAKIVVPRELEAAASQRYCAWYSTFKPEDENQEFELAFAVEASLRIENCRARERLRKIELAKIAEDPGTKWQTDRKQEAARLARSLKRNPEVIALQLRSTPAGRRWLIQAWQLLLVVVAEGERPAWTATDSNDALDLMGHPKGRRGLFLERMNPFTNPEAIRALIFKEIASLEAENAGEAEEDAELRSLHVQGLIFESDATLTLIRRYETSARRQLDQSLKSIKQAKAVSKPSRARTSRALADSPARNSSDCETNPISRSPDGAAVTSREPSACEMNPISAPAAPEIATSPRHVATAESPPAKEVGNRRLRRKREREARRLASLARKGR